MTQKNETIVDRVVQRLQTQPLGDLITEEDLHDIVKEAIPKAFFAPQYRTEGSGYSARQIEMPPRVVAMANEALQASVKKAVDEWVVANADKFAEVWKPLMEKGIEKWLMDRHTEALKVHMRDVLAETFNRINHAYPLNAHKD